MKKLIPLVGWLSGLAGGLLPVFTEYALNHPSSAIGLLVAGLALNHAAPSPVVKQ